MKVRTMLMLIAALSATVLLGGLFAVNQALSYLDSPEPLVDLSCSAMITGEREVTISIEWKWNARNARPGMADEIVVLGPDGWQTADAPGTKPPTGTGPAGQVEFWIVGDAAHTVNSMIETGNVKAYAAVRPNENGTATIYLNTDSDPVESEDKVTVQYLLVKRIPSPEQASQRPTLMDRFLRLVGVTERMQIMHVEKQVSLSPWIPGS